jgi:hypothetical protein
MVIKPVTDELVIRPARRPDDRPYLCSVSFSLPHSGSQRQVHRAQLVLFTGERETTSVDLSGSRVAQLACALDDGGHKAEVQVQVLTADGIALLSRAAVWLPGEGT